MPADGTVRTLQARDAPLLHGPVHHNPFAALRTGKRLDCRESREGVQRAAMRATDTTNHSRCHLQQDSGSEFHGHCPDDLPAFVTGYVSLIAAQLDSQAPAAICSCSRFVRDDRNALLITRHILIFPRSGGRRAPVPWSFVEGTFARIPQVFHSRFRSLINLPLQWPMPLSSFPVSASFCRSCTFVPLTP